ncbi:MAG TPA: VOC family protein [Candidatus Binatia bacterium]|nr:VOC family protein [Candidatus Binatia bacterium]
MIEIAGVYEVAVKVRDLDRAQEFYCNVLGLEVGLRDETRRWSFLRAGGLGGMVVLQEDGGPWPQQHFAFTVALGSMDRALATLSAHGVALEGPMTHDWIPARSVYFADPDGHDVELLAPITNG